jgi:hypothetical protein
VAGQTLTLSGSGTLAGANVGSQNVSSLGTLALGDGTGLASNYTLVGGTDVVNVTPAPLTITGSTIANSKVYDTTTIATLNISSTTLAGIFTTDMGNVHIAGGSGIFASPNVGNAIAVTASGFTLSGTAAGNYAIASSSYPTGLVANITPALLTVSGTTTADNKVFDGNTLAQISTKNNSLQGILGSDAVTLNGGIGTFATASVGNNISVTVDYLNLSGADAANYTIASALPTNVTADITPAPAPDSPQYGVAGYWYTPTNMIISPDSSSSLSVQPINEVAPGMTVGVNLKRWSGGSVGGQFVVYESVAGRPIVVYSTAGSRKLSRNRVGNNGRVDSVAQLLSTRTLSGMPLIRSLRR